MRRGVYPIFRFLMVGLLFGVLSPSISIDGSGSYSIFQKAEARRGGGFRGRGGGFRGSPRASRYHGGNFQRAKPVRRPNVGVRPQRPAIKPARRPLHKPQRPPHSGKPPHNRPRPPHSGKPPHNRPRPPHSGKPPHHRPRPPHHRPRPPHHHNDWYRPIGVGLGVAIGVSILANLPPECVEERVNGKMYYNCGGTYYLPFYDGDVLKYKKVPAPK